MDCNADTLFINAEIITDGLRRHGYVAVHDGVVAEVSDGAPESELVDSASVVVDLNGLMLFPGIIDTHVHFRDPGLTHKGDMATESGEALAGGITFFCDMPNCKPPTVSLETWEQKVDRASDVSKIDGAFFIGATNGNIDVLRSMKYPPVPGIKLFMGSSTGGMLVNDDAILDEIFSLGRLVVAHCEDEGIVSRNSEAMRQKYGDEEVPISEHPNIRSREACVLSSKKAIDLALKHNTRLHIAHVSTAEELAMIEALPEGHRITAEACIGHLWFCDEDYPRKGAAIKCNPAIKTRNDRDALRKALGNGVITTIATDHAPHLWQEKQGGALKAASGMPMVRWSLPVMLTLASQGIISYERISTLMCANPARLIGLHDRGSIAPGMRADMVVVDPNAEYEIAQEDIVAKCGWSPMTGETLCGRVVATYVKGKLKI